MGDGSVSNRGEEFMNPSQRCQPFSKLFKLGSANSEIAKGVQNCFENPQIGVKSYKVFVAS